MTRLLRLGLQYARFGTVGAVATAAHVVVFAALVELAEFMAVAANFIAFCVAVCVSYFGHYHWTFRDQTMGAEGARQGVSLVRFTTVALVGLTVSSALVYVVVNLLHLPYPVAIGVVVVVTPLLTFGLSKVWAFASVAETQAPRS